MNKKISYAKQAQIAPARMFAMEKYGLKVRLQLADYHCLVCVAKATEQ